ncbi:MAG: Gfo/Idh/MocA family oxidoreductase [Calditrichaeota bacterium]|nr:Gfo/Idh/MocA family oxidoreductase [Candidatus Cloacimonadota bacterium]MCA9787181.1 Gfo/Idh/MocA family oxidoreductase [Candidatus Cloacimonadota bacterium]MCB1047857.1 Gfo/Idh/MocA family oxidoreductase [Calditrichota bacterium]MCB9473768.1 Gfo/Idh/MocA family oxidoreductase [Candidatus Delongbacteria bacterium]
MERIPIGIIGCGQVSQVYHIPSVRESEDFELVALCDAQFRMASQLASRCESAQAYRDPLELMRSSGARAVIIATPTHLHMPYVIQALTAGLHVLVETPVTLNAKEIQKLQRARDQHPESLLQIGFNNRYRADVNILRNFLVQNELGRIFYIKCGWLRKFGGQPPKGWRYEAQQSGGGVLMDGGVALIDVLLWLLNYPEVESVHGAVYHDLLRKDVEDTATAHLRLAGGTVIHLDASWSLLPEENKTYGYFFGSKGSAFMNPLRITREAAGQRYSMTPATLPKGADLYTESYRSQLSHFAEVIRNGSTDDDQLAQTLQVMKVVDAIYRSAESGKTVRL